MRLVSLVRRNWEKARRVPTELAAELAHAGSVGQEAWVRAREQSDFGTFAPYLERNLELTRRYVDCHAGHDGFTCAYDVLLDDYEPQMATAAVAALFAELKAELVPLIARVTRLSESVDDARLHAEFPIARQRELVAEVVAMMGFDAAGWRLDDTVHPFASRIGVGDVRITTRWDERFFPMGAVRRDARVRPRPVRSRAAGGARALTARRTTESLGLHESQSRLWENMVGRGRAFSGVLAPRIAELAGGELSDLDASSLYRLVNRVQPSHIRVEADEATYALHIILRFELEQALLDGELGSGRPSGGVGRAVPRPISGSRSPTSPTACSRMSTGRRV